MKPTLRLFTCALAAALLVLSARAQQLLTPTYQSQLEVWLGQGSLVFNKIFTKVAGDGQTATDFHNAVDNKGPTFVLLSVYGSAQGVPSNLPSQIVGGYNPQSWDRSTGWYHLTPNDADRTAFIFNLSYSTVQRQNLIGQGVDDFGAMQTFNWIDWGPLFGGGHDLCAYSNQMEWGFARNYSYGGTIGSSPITYGGSADGLGDQDWFQVARFEVYTFTKATNTAPVASAGNNVYLLSGNQNITVIAGTASDADDDALTYQWFEGTTVLASGQVDSSGAAPLNLVQVPALSVGAHTLTLVVSDGKASAQSGMILTIENSPPTAAPSGDGTYQIGTPVVLGGQVADYDGDTLTYSWLDGATVLGSSVIQTPKGGAPVYLPEYATTSLGLGDHAVTLLVSDGINAPVAKTEIVTMNDTIAPTVAPVASQTIIWPPNNKMVPITIHANAADNSGLPVYLAATVSCDESQAGTSFWTTPVVNQKTGIISLYLQAARFGNGNGRTYTVTIEATDEAGNTSIGCVTIVVPHDRGK